MPTLKRTLATSKPPRSLTPAIRIFEIGSVFEPSRGALPREELRVAALIMGRRTPRHFSDPKDKDFERWRRFIAARPEITHLSFEFTTGAGAPDQRANFAARLIDIARAAGRPLHLVLMGGKPVWHQLASAFETLTILETSIFMKTMHRRLAVPSGKHRVRHHRVQTAPGQPLDELLAANAVVIGAAVAQTAMRPI